MTRIAGGIGHEFRNLLMIIQNYAEFIEEKLPPDSDLREDLAEIIQAAERGSQLTNELLAFGRAASAGTRAMEVAEAMDAVQPRLLAHVGESVRLRVNVTPGLPPIDVEAERFGQILETVVRHAIEALEACEIICIEATRTDLDERYASEHPAVSPGSYVAITVSNTDCPAARGGARPGVRRAVRDARGEPGRARPGARAGGHGVVGRRHRGPVRQAAGHGRAGAASVGRRTATCRSTCPACGCSSARTSAPSGRCATGRSAKPASRSSSPRTATRGSGRSPRRSRRAGASTCSSATSSCPGSSGFDVADAARERYPDIAILLMTGYSEQLSRRDPPAGTVVLEKPFAPSALLRRVLSLVA